jgi:autotransporter-associated beta strand protein
MKHATRFSHLFIAITACAFLSSATFANAAGHHARLKRQQQKQERLLAAAAAGSLHTSKMLERFGGDAGAVAPAGVSLALAPAAPTATIEWANVSTDWATGSNWVGGTAPADSVTTDIASFGSLNGAAVNPNLAAARSVNGVSFLSGAFSYNIFGSSLTIGASGISNAATNGEGFANALRISANQAWTNNGGSLDFVAVDLNATSAAGRTLTVTGSGTTTISGVIQNSFAGSTGNLTYTRTGTLNLQGTNTYTGTTTLSGGTIGIGNNSAFGTSAVTLGNTILQATGADRSLSNNVSYTATTGATMAGTQSLTFTGSWTDNASRTLTNNISVAKNLTLAGNVFLSDNNTTTSRRLTIAGSGNTVISGVIANNNFGNAIAAGLTFNGTSILSLTNTNTFSGGTLINAGTVQALADGALGTGFVSITAGTASLTLSGGATNNYIGNAADLSIVTGTGTVALSYSGTDTIGGLIINGTAKAIGQWGAIGSGAANQDAAFSGAGFLNVTTLATIPEPSTWMMLGVGAVLFAGVQRLRRKN